MNQSVTLFWMRLALQLGLVACSTLAWGQSAPSTQQMIEQLQPPKTRSLRNLTIEATPGALARPGADAAEAARPPAGAQPSLSLLIQFDFNSAGIRQESRPALANLAQALQSLELSKSRFAVEGHTDAKGRADYNVHLSQQRADAVRDYLVDHGVGSARLVASGKGATELAQPATPFAAENRRVRIVNLN